MNTTANRSASELVWVIGGGSGIGRATALRLAASGRRVVVSGRRPDALDETVRQMRGVSRGDIEAVPVDASNPDSLVGAHEHIARVHGPVGTLVFAAGTNLGVNRWWSELTPADFRAVVDVNLNAAVGAISAVLPDMREVGGGRIFVIGSWAGWRYMSVAGAAYSATKTGLASIVESLNDQEGRSGIRATLVIPGEVNTEILLTRPVPPSDEEKAALLDPDDIARIVENISDLPFRVCVNEVVVSGVLNGIYLRDSKYPGRVAIDGTGR